MNLSTVKSELAAAVAAAGIPGLDTYAFVPDRPSIPCFYAGEVTIEPNNTFGGSDVADVTCRVLVAHSDDLDGQLLLDKYLSRDGAYSIRAALFAARGEPGELALNGAADDLAVIRIDGYRTYADSENNAFYGADITVRVIGS